MASLTGPVKSSACWEGPASGFRVARGGEGVEEKEREKKNEYESANDEAQVKGRERMRGM